MVSRKQIQEKIDVIIKNNPKGDLDYIKGQISGWLDQQDLPYEGMAANFIRDRILSDLTSYEGVI